MATRAGRCSRDTKVAALAVRHSIRFDGEALDDDGQIRCREAYPNRSLSATRVRA
jgi:hypothetical protein